MNLRYIAFLPLTLLSLIAIIHNAYLAKETASLHTGNAPFDWFLAVLFALGIESGLWVLIIHKKTVAVKAYAVVLLSLNLLYYGRSGKLNTIISLWHPDAWLYIEGITTAVIFSVLLSGFAWYLTEVIIEQLRDENRTAGSGNNTPNLAMEAGLPDYRTGPIPRENPVPLTAEPSTFAVHSTDGSTLDIPKLTGDVTLSIDGLFVPPGKAEPPVDVIKDDGIRLATPQEVLPGETLQDAVVQPIKPREPRRVKRVVQLPTPSADVLQMASAGEFELAPRAAPRACLQCKNDFLPAKWNARYCSPKCKNKFHYAKNEIEQQQVSA